MSASHILRHKFSIDFIVLLIDIVKVQEQAGTHSIPKDRFALSARLNEGN